MEKITIFQTTNQSWSVATISILPRRWPTRQRRTWRQLWPFLLTFGGWCAIRGHLTKWDLFGNQKNTKIIPAESSISCKWIASTISQEARTKIYLNPDDFWTPAMPCTPISGEKPPRCCCNCPRPCRGPAWPMNGWCDNYMWVATYYVGKLIPYSPEEL